MIKINKPLVVAQTQTYKIDEIHIVGGSKGIYNAVVSFVIFDEEGKPVKGDYLSFSGEEFNKIAEQLDDFTSHVFDKLEEKNEIVPDERGEMVLRNEISKENMV